MSSSATPTNKPANLTLDEINRGLQLLSLRLTDILNFEPDSILDRSDPRIKGLEAAINSSLAQVFGTNTAEAEIYRAAGHIDRARYNYARPPAIDEVQKGLQKGKNQALALIRVAIDDLKARVFLDAAAKTKAFYGVEDDEKEDGAMTLSSEIFIVHGHDDGARAEVSDFLRKAGFIPIVLHEQANAGRTIIEKLERFAAVDFAIVLLTPDDEGSSKGQAPRPRARQNVIGELFYFIGRLGRDRVCALKKGDIEFPSDIAGVVYTEMDSHGGWHSKLLREMEAAGYEIDWARAMA